MNSWPLLDRSGQIRLIDATLTRGTPTGLLVVGRRGRGKTRLLAEACHRATAKGLPTAWISATPAERDLPFSSLAQLVDRADGADSWRTVRRAVLRALSGPRL